MFPISLHRDQILTYRINIAEVVTGLCFTCCVSVCVCQLESAGRVLKVTGARIEDSGKYTCLATNAAGEAQQHMRLSVHGN